VPATPSPAYPGRRRSLILLEPLHLCRSATDQRFKTGSKARVVIAHREQVACVQSA
jgi:hypothetical protein